MKTLTFILLLFCFVVKAQLTTNTSLTPEQLIKNILTGKGVTVSNVTYVGEADAVGEFDGSNSNIGISDGIILSTGTVLNNPGSVTNKGPVGPNNNAGASTKWNAPGDVELTNLIGDDTFDAAILEFDFIPQGDRVDFNYVFASEEYPEFVFSFNDVFAFFISGPGIPGGVQNLAVVPGTANPVSINEINATTNASLFVANGDGVSGTQLNDSNVTNFDGFTVPLLATSAVIPCQMYHLKIAIADVVDGSFDSGVFLKGGSLSSNPRFETKQNATIDVGTPNLIPEGCSDGLLELTRTEGLSSPFTIDYRVLGTADNGVDYATLSGSVTFVANSDKTTVSIVTLSDAIVEGNETVILRFPNSDICNLDSLDYKFTITELSEMTSLPDSVQTTCPGASITIDANFSGGFGPNTYVWNSGGDEISENVSPNATKNYQFTVTDVCGTTTSNNFKVEVPTVYSLGLTMPNDTFVICKGENLAFIPTVSGGSGDYDFSWQTGETALSINPQIVTSTTFILKVTDACGDSKTDSVYVALNYSELKVDIINDTTVCPGDSVIFTASGIGGIPPYTFVWENGSQNHTTIFSSQTTKIINISVTDSCGIIPISDSVDLNIQQPVASFVINSSRLETDEVIYFVDNSQGSIDSYDWDLGNGVSSTLSNPSTIYTDDSTYSVMLTVADSLGCKDSILQDIKIVPPLYLWVPNAFTPDTDGDILNSVFTVKGIGVMDFEMIIFNRWGQQVFFSNDFHIGWDGRLKSGKPAPVDVYIYKIFLTGESGKEIEKMGTITLIR